MKNNKKPVKPRLPEEPKQKIIYRHFLLDDPCGYSWSISYLREQFEKYKEEIRKSNKNYNIDFEDVNVKSSIDEYEGDPVTLAYIDHEIDNPDYQKQKSSYDKRYEKYQEDLKKYEEDLKKEKEIKKQKELDLFLKLKQKYGN